VDIDIPGWLNTVLIACSVLLALTTILVMVARRGQRSSLDPVLLVSALVVVALAAFLMFTR
jgi:uncharacterized membrane protein